MTSRFSPAVILVALLSVAVLAGCAPDASTGAGERPDSFTDNPWDDVVTCLEEAGYPGFIADSGGITAPPGSSDDEEQFKLLLAAEAQCADEAGFYSGPIPDDELPRLYALELEEIECLQGLGYETPEPPSLQTYIDDYSSGTPWEAAFELYFSLPLSDQTEDALNHINTVCPPPASRFTRE
jgi:hypothetical protein